MPICRYFTGATGLEPATSGVTGRYRLNRHDRLRPRITGWSGDFVLDRTGYDRLRPATTWWSLCSTCVIDLFARQQTGGARLGGGGALVCRSGTDVPTFSALRLARRCA